MKSEVFAVLNKDIFLKNKSSNLACFSEHRAASDTCCWIKHKTKPQK